LSAAGLVPRVRGRFLVLEAVFTVIFHAALPATTDAYIKDFICWDEVPWKPLCSRLSIGESVGGNLSMSVEELQAASAIRHGKMRAYNRTYQRKWTRAVIQDGRYACKLCNLNLWLAQKLAKHQTTKAYLSKILVALEAALEKDFCKLCNREFHSADKLAKHQKSKEHQSNVPEAQKLKKFCKPCIKSIKVPVSQGT
jgi:hypothetical protein